MARVHAATQAVRASVDTAKASAAPLVNLLVTLLALIGALTLVLSIRAGSVETAGRTMDGWIATAWAHGQALIDRTPSPSR